VALDIRWLVCYFFLMQLMVIEFIIFISFFTSQNKLRL
jgi:hypothetical protein